MSGDAASGDAVLQGEGAGIILCAVDNLTDRQGTAGPPDLIHIA